MDNKIIDIPMISCKSDLIDYRHAMHARFGKDFPRLATALRQVRPFEPLQDIPLGTSANQPNPGPMPELLPANATAQAREAKKYEMDVWKFAYTLYSQYTGDIIAVSGFICESVTGDALIRLRAHAEFQNVTNNNQFLRLWQIVLELYTAQGSHRERLINESIANLYKIKMYQKESLTEYYGRFQRIQDECIDLGIKLESKQVCTALVYGLPDEYQNFKEYFGINQAMNNMHITEIKQMIDNIPTLKKKSIQDIQNSMINSITVNKNTFASMKLWKDMSIEEKLKKIASDKEKTSQKQCFKCGEKGHVMKKCQKNIPST